MTIGGAADPAPGRHAPVPRVLVVCTGNAARSRMAEAFLAREGVAVAARMAALAAELRADGVGATG